MTNLDSVFKSRDITLPTKVHTVKAMVFPLITYSFENWFVKKAECQRTDAFELWCWKRLLRVPWAARRSNQSILREINPEYSLEGLMLKLLQSFGHLMQRTDSLEKALMPAKIEGRRRRGYQRMRWLALGRPFPTGQIRLAIPVLLLHDFITLKGMIYAKSFEKQKGYLSTNNAVNCFGHDFSF